jgi:ankyrin repeat protein
MMSKKEKEEFNNSLKEVLGNSFKNINKRDKEGRTMLHYVVGTSNSKTVRLLIEKGVDVNAIDVGGYTPLHLAVTAQNLENVKELIRSGAAVNAKEYGSKNTPLHLGCMIGVKEIVEELVKAGGEIEQEDEFGMTAMNYAKNSKEITEVLKKETDRIEKLFEKQVREESKNKKGKPSMRG